MVSEYKVWMKARQLASVVEKDTPDQRWRFDPYLDNIAITPIGLSVCLLVGWDGPISCISIRR